MTTSALPGTSTSASTTNAPRIAKAAAPAITTHKTATTTKTASTTKTATTTNTAAGQQTTQVKAAAPKAGTTGSTGTSGSHAVAGAALAKPKDPPAISANGAATTKVSLCVAVQRLQATVQRGQAGTWIISAWTTGGNVPDATVRLVTAPAGLTAMFTFGCGSEDGTASCDLGEIAAQSSARQLEAEVQVPATASVSNVQLSVVASAAHLPTDPRATASMPVTAATATGSGGGGGGTQPLTTTNPLPVGNLPEVNGVGGTSGTLSPGGNAGGLFPTLSPSPNPNGTQGQNANAKTVANSSDVPLGAPVVGAQLVGLGVLALAFVLAVTRMSIRRRPAHGKAQPARGSSTAGKDKGTPEGDG